MSWKAFEEQAPEAENIAASSVVIDAYALFEFQVDNVMAIKYDQDGKRTVHRWRRDKVDKR